MRNPINRIPVSALSIGLLVQMLVTMAAYSVAAAAPAISAHLGVAGERVGVFISMVYGVGMISAILSPSFIHRYGAVRVSQYILLAGIAMILVIAVGGSVVALAIGAVLLGLGYGATAPTSSHLLMKRTPAAIRNLVFSIRQIGVPLGGVVGGLIVPPLVILFGWQIAIGVQVIPALLLLVILQMLRAGFDYDRNTRHIIRSAGLFAPLLLLKNMPGVRMLALAVFFFAGTQLCFVAYISVHLTSQADFGLIAAGQMLAVYQISGVISRPIWGVIADRWISARVMLGAMGLIMAVSAGFAGQFSASWSGLSIFLVLVVAGATASGYTGIAFAEFARIGGSDSVAEATGLGAFTQFFGVMVLPTLFSALVSVSGYGLAYNVIALLAVASGLGLLLVRKSTDSQHS